MLVEDGSDASDVSPGPVTGLWGPPSHRSTDGILEASLLRKRRRCCCSRRHPMSWTVIVLFCIRGSVRMMPAGTRGHEPPREQSAVGTASPQVSTLLLLPAGWGKWVAILYFDDTSARFFVLAP